MKEITIIPARRYQNLDDKNRLFGNVGEFDDWYMATIINHFLERDLTNLHERLRFRRALLMSREVRSIIKGERVMW